jgi:hypothetical protein
MKSIPLIVLLLTVAFALGCQLSEKKPPSQASRDGATDVRHYTFGQKTEFVMAMKVQLAELNKGIDALAVTIEKSNDTVQADAAPKLVELREKATKLGKEIEDDADATLPTWSVMKNDTEKSYANLKDGIAELQQAITGKVAP